MIIPKVTTTTCKARVSQGRGGARQERGEKSVSENHHYKLKGVYACHKCVDTRVDRANGTAIVRICLRTAVRNIECVSAH